MSWIPAPDSALHLGDIVGRYPIPRKVEKDFRGEVVGFTAQRVRVALRRGDGYLCTVLRTHARLRLIARGGAAMSDLWTLTLNPPPLPPAVMREANKAALAEKRHAYYEANKAALAEKQRAYYEANKARRLALEKFARNHGFTPCVSKP